MLNQVFSKERIEALKNIDSLRKNIYFFILDFLKNKYGEEKLGCFLVRVCDEKTNEIIVRVNYMNRDITLSVNEIQGYVFEKFYDQLIYFPDFKVVSNYKSNSKF